MALLLILVAGFTYFLDVIHKKKVRVMVWSNGSDGKTGTPESEMDDLHPGHR